VTVYDGLYLILAAGNGSRVITADRRLREAGREGAIQDVVDWVGGDSVPDRLRISGAA
jgi:hypothetical protein